MTRSPLWIASALAAVVVTGCASVKAARAREAYLKAQLEPLVYDRPIEGIWTDVRKLLNEKGYPLAGEDAVAAGQTENWFASFLTPAMETRTGRAEDSAEAGFLPGLLPSKAPGKGEETWRYLKTGLSKQLKMYRVDAVADGPGWRVVFTSYQASPTDHQYFLRDTAKRDHEMELELARRVDPAAAARIEANMP
jgi:hypothetical protein